MEAGCYFENIITLSVKKPAINAKPTRASEENIELKSGIYGCISSLVENIDKVHISSDVYLVGIEAYYSDMFRII